MMNYYQKYKIEILFISFMFFVFITLAFIIPFNGAPDEVGRYQLAEFMYNYNKLPLGTDPEVLFPGYGVSYAFSPYLSYMIGAFLMKIMSIFTVDPDYLLFAARMSSIFCSLITIVFLIKISNLLFKDWNKWLFIILCSSLPMFVFVSTYVNCDALAITSSSIIIYAWLIGRISHWDKRSCIYLIFGLSLCLLSYKNAYGYILVTVFIYIYELLKSFKNKNTFVLLKKGLIIACSVVILGGWFYIRNYVAYNGDIMATKVSYELAQREAIDELKPDNRSTPMKNGNSLSFMLFDMKWFEITYNSFIGVFDYMSLPLPLFFYNIYSFIFIFGIGGLVNSFRKTKKMEPSMLFFHFCMVLNIIIPICLSIFYSYTSDFQPQGRYILPILIPLMYYISIGLTNVIYLFKNEYRNNIVRSFACLSVLSIIYIIINVFAITYLA